MISQVSGSPIESSGTVSWRSPSNIALVKYWGKKNGQIPMNPSISMTLSRAFTETSIDWMPRKGNGEDRIRFFFEDERNIAFEARVVKYIHSLEGLIPGLAELNLTIHSGNSFPHSSGIASSASAMSALALSLLSIFKSEQEKDFFREASYLARLGSGSACRSVYGGYVLWGTSPIVEDSSEEYAVTSNHLVDEKFKRWNDAILIVSSSKKEVSSSAGHGLMKGHFFAKGRIHQADKNLLDLFNALHEGDEVNFARIVENEALSLHGLMLSSNPSFLLMAPGTIEIIQKIRQFREQTGIPVCFSLDAGPNIHLLYPDASKGHVLGWIKNELTRYCENGYWIDDQMGKGPERVL